jgi:hypothetical protein
MRRQTVFYSQPVTDVIAARHSSRAYLTEPIAAGERRRLADFLATLDCGPLGTPARFELIAAAEQEPDALLGLGTYGAVKRAAGFIVGAVREGQKNLEDCGCLMERAVLMATDLGLGTCWLGGFSKGNFAKKIAVQAGEIVPAVAAVGYSAGPAARIRPAGDNRLPWEQLFFQQRFGSPLARETAGAHAAALDAVRLGPSASNKQPWRIIQDGSAWHFYLQRTRGYRERLVARLLGVADLQRLDMGIAMCHFELTATELGQRGLANDRRTGRWVVSDPAVAVPDALAEYVVSWIGG